MSGSVRSVTTLAHRLGHPADARLLIVNCDDLGMCHSANEGVYSSLRDGLATSATLMVPCPWAREAAAHYRGEDVGVHLTLNAEWELYRWGPITVAPSPGPSTTSGTTPTWTRCAASCAPRSSGRSCGAST